jgi:hypothetical protein
MGPGPSENSLLLPKPSQAKPSRTKPPYSSACRYHRAALTATRSFWRLLLKDKISLVQLSRAFRAIDVMEGMADKVWHAAADRGRPWQAHMPAHAHTHTHTHTHARTHTRTHAQMCGPSPLLPTSPF